MSIRNTMHKKRSKFCTRCRVSSAKIYIYHSSKIAKASPVQCGLGQGPLKKWTEHSQELHLFKIHSRGAPITPRGWMGVDFLDHELL